MTVAEEPVYTQEELEKLWSDYMIDGARYGDLDDVVEALKHQAKVDATDSNGGTALHMAAANTHLEIAQHLLRAGANTEVKNSAGNTALHWACLSQSPGEHFNLVPQYCKNVYSADTCSTCRDGAPTLAERCQSSSSE